MFGKTCELHNGLQRGSCIAIAQDLTTLPNDLLEAKPTMLYSVPTLFKRVYDRIQDKVGHLLSPIIRRSDLLLRSISLTLAPFTMCSLPRSATRPLGPRP